MKPTLRNRFNPCFSSLALAAFLGLGTTATHAGIITFGSATTISGDTNVFTVGSAGYAYTLSSASPTVTVNGVTFTGASSTTALGTNVSMSGFSSNGSTTFKGTTSGTWNGLSTAYKGILQGANYGNTAAATVTLNNLTSGHVYATQIWVNDSRATGSGRTETVNGGGNTVTLDYNNTNALNGVGQFTIGRFAADSTTQAFTLTGSASSQMNAIQLRDVTNIGNWIGTGGATWDAASTNNFASNVFSAALTSTTFATGKTPMNAVTFADSYWNSGTATTVTQTSVTVAAGGVSTGTVYFDNSAVNYNISSADATGITGSTAIIKTGAGMVTLSGTNTYTGATTVQGGTLKVSTGGVINNAATSGGTGIVIGGSTLDINGGTVNFNGANALIVGDNTTAGNVIVRAGSNLNLTGAIPIGQGSSGAGDTPVSTFTQSGGTTTIGASSTLYLGNYRGATMDIQGGTLTSSSSANIGIRGNSTLTISGANTGVTFTSVALGNAFGYTNATSDVNLNGGTLTLGTSGFTIADTAGAKTVNFDGGTLKASATSADFVNANSVYVKAGGATIDTDIYDVTIDNALLQSEATTGTLTKAGAGKLTLTATNTYTGTTNIKNGSIILGVGNDRLKTTGSVLLGETSTAGKLVLGDGTARNQTLAGLTTTGSGGSVVGGAGTDSTLTLNIASSNIYGGTLGGGGTNENKLALNKTGAGTLTLTGENTYTGATMIDGGSVALGTGGSIDHSSGVNLINGGNFNVSALSNYSVASLTGNGSVTGDVTVTGALGIGASAGTVTFNDDLTLGTSALSTFEINGFTTGLYDLAQGRHRLSDRDLGRHAHFEFLRGIGWIQHHRLSENLRLRRLLREFQSPHHHQRLWPPATPPRSTPIPVSSPSSPSPPPH